jgi:hypothetical protein
MRSRRGRPAVVLALLGVFLLATLLAVDPAHDEVDVAQERANAALPALPGGCPCPRPLWRATAACGPWK